MVSRTRPPAVLISLEGPDASTWRTDRPLFGERPVLWTGQTGLYEGDAGDLAAVGYLLAWSPRRDLLSGLPNLEIIFSLGAGADGLLGIDTLPDVPIVRFVDPSLSAQMREYVLWQVFHHFRRAEHYRRCQAERAWAKRPQPAAHDVTVGILGAGVLGRDAAAHLAHLGFDVRIWSRTGARIGNVRSFAGPGELDAFLGGTDIAVSLLPITAQTRGLLDASLIGRLRRDGPLGGPVLINAGRGGCQVEADIADALRSGALAGASLDVFETEPLPDENPLWDCPNLVITPHNASASDPQALVTSMRRQIEAHERGEPLQHVVDRDRGY